MEPRKTIILEIEGLLLPMPSLLTITAEMLGNSQVYHGLARYDALCARQGKAPGQACAYLLPFLLHAGITQEAVAEVAKTQPLATAAREFIGWLQERGWRLFCITSAYDLYAQPLLERLHIPLSYLASTRLPLARFQNFLQFAGLDVLKGVPLMEEVLCSWQAAKSRVWKRQLDSFFARELPGTPLGGMVQAVKPLVGHRKVEALQALIHLWKATPADTMVVGTSPLDTAMLSAMAQAGGAGIMMGARKLASHGATSVATIEELRVFLQDWEGAHLAS